VAADEAGASQQLLADVRAGTALEVEVVVPGSTGVGTDGHGHEHDHDSAHEGGAGQEAGPAGEDEEPLAADPAPSPGAGDLVLRIVGREPADAGAGDPMAAFRNERVRWVRHAFTPGIGGTWVLRAEVDLQVTHADDFLDNAFTSLAPVFDGWAVTPLETRSTTR
jgi:hypothetical protein